MRTLIRPTPLHFHDVAGHFLALTPNDRLLRFGWPMTDAQIVAYVESLFVLPEPVWAVVEPDGQVTGVMHLESMGCGVTLGLSVSASARNQGIGTLLLRRAALLADERSLSTLFVRNLDLNHALQRLARHPGMTITLADDSQRSQWTGAAPEAGRLDQTSTLDFSGVEQLTLSACNTASGGGRDENGIEVEGMAAVVAAQGAGSVLASLWPRPR